MVHGCCYEPACVNLLLSQSANLHFCSTFAGLMNSVTSVFFHYNL